MRSAITGQHCSRIGQNSDKKIKNKSLYLSVRVFSTVIVTVDTVNKQTHITNRTEICQKSQPVGG